MENLILQNSVVEVSKTSDGVSVEIICGLDNFKERYVYGDDSDWDPAIVTQNFTRADIIAIAKLLDIKPSELNSNHYTRVIIKREITHPGEILKDFLKEADLGDFHTDDPCATGWLKGASWLAVKTGLGLDYIVGLCLFKKESIDYHVAYELAQVFGTTPEFWMNLQENYNNAQ